MDDLLRPQQVASKLNVSRQWVYNAAADGRIPSVRLGHPDGPVRFIERDIDAWIEQARAAWQPGDSSASTLRRASDVPHETDPTEASPTLGT
jgi:excisionase family DNA binding protein